MSTPHSQTAPVTNILTRFPGTSRRSVRCAGLLGLAALLAFSTQARDAQASPMPPTRPLAPGGKPWNVLLILADDLGAHDLGCDGGRYYDTPNLDRLAAEGMRFTRAYAAAPSCTPTRVALLTGQAPARSGITHVAAAEDVPASSPMLPPKGYGSKTIPSPNSSLAGIMKRHGYATGQWGKWHMPGEPDQLGFQQGGNFKMGIHDFPGASVARTPETEAAWVQYTTAFPDLAPGEYAEDEITDKAIEFIKTHRGKPWFYYCDPFLVHTPILSRQKWLIDKYTARFGEMGATKVNATYGAMVETLDWCVGRLLDTLDELGLRENTIVIFTSDNGGLETNWSWPSPVTDNDPLRGGKVSLFEGGLRVPLIVRWPGVVAPGTTCDAPVSTCDFFPTIAQATGTTPDPDHTLDGESLVPLLTQKSDQLRRDALYWHFPHDSRWHRFSGAIREGRWKMILSYGNEGTALYDLDADPAETTDLSAEHPERAAALEARLRDWLKDVGAMMPVPNPAAAGAKARPMPEKSAPVVTGSAQARGN